VRRLNLRYFREYKHRMRYATLAAENYHIGSGLVKNACVTVVGMRRKGSGMCRSQAGAEAMLNPRALLLTDPDVDLKQYATGYIQ